MTKIPHIDIPDYLNQKRDPYAEPTPLQVLDQAASDFGGKTGHLILAKVTVAPFLGQTRYTFSLIIAAADAYREPLFYVWNKESGKDYPVLVLATGLKSEDAAPCNSADDLSTYLQDQVFNNQWAKVRIGQWIELARERSGRSY